MMSRTGSRIGRAGHRTGIGIAALAVAAIASGCAFVKVDEDALGVEVRKTTDEVADCTQKGTVSASTKANVGFVARGETTVAVELERLARNRAVNLGANVIVPSGPVSAEGTRDYSAWSCPE